MSDLLNIDPNFQWIAAIFLPFIREANVFISLYFARKACDGDPASVEVTLNHAVGTTHALFLAYTCGSVATFATGLGSTRGWPCLQTLASLGTGPRDEAEDSHL